MTSTTSLKRSWRLALQNLWRNKLLTSVTVLIMALILFIFNVVLTVNMVAQDAIQNLKSKVDIILYLADDADPLRLNQLKQELQALHETAQITHITKEQALQGLLDKYPENLNPFTDDQLENPLPASLQVITHQPENHATLLTYLNQSEYADLFLNVESSDDNQLIVQNLINITSFSEKLLLGVLLAFILGSILIITNAIHVTIFNRKQEIQVMQMVGAPRQFIQAPFLIEGTIYGILSVILSMILLWGFINLIDFSRIGSSGQLPFTMIFISQVIASALLGMSSSSLALHRYLKPDNLSIA